MKVRVLNKFKDLKENVIRKEGTTFECADERYAEIMAVKTKDGKDLIKEVKPRKTKAKVKPVDISECVADTDE